MNLLPSILRTLSSSTLLIAAASSTTASPGRTLGPAPADRAPAEEVRFAGGGFMLAGTLTFPEGEGPHPVMILTHGSEPGRRQGYALYAQTFLDHGLAVLRYDKRGVGDSEGDYVEAPDLRQPCADLLGAVAWVATHPGIDGERIGVFGASQGGWVAPMAAALCDRIRFVCVQSAPGVSPLEQNLYDKGNQLRRQGVSTENVARATEYRRAYWGYLIGGEGFEQAEDLHAAISSEPWFTQESFPFPFMRREEFLRHPRLRNWALHNSYEPRLTLERVQVPLLAVFGGSDSIVPVEESVARFRNAFAVSGNSALTIRVHEGADHGIRITEADGTRAFAPGYFEDLGEWAARRAFEDD